MKWNKQPEYYEGTTDNFIYRDKIASFDLDDTLIHTKSKKKFAIDGLDWKFAFSNLPDKIKELHNDGYSIIVISNQAGIASGKTPGDEWTKKLDSISEILGIEMKVFCSISKNKYRKPHTSFFDEFLPNKLNKKSFYCGDAVGRTNDFADTDYKFALNLGINFYTPEHLFQEKKNDLPLIKYCIDIKNTNNDIDKSNEFIDHFNKINKELIIMVGFPGSGKSTISKELKTNFGYEVINQDTLKTPKKCILETEKNMKKEKSIIIDSTNPSKLKRKAWIDLANDNNYSVRIIEMTTSIDKSKHNNIYRSLCSGTNPVPDIAYNMYKSKYEKPSKSENVFEILSVDQENPKDLKYWKYMY
jgi:bifunctional polynucleotide phosphatase/kinase